MKYFLITTALEETWCDDRPVLFIGEWCRLYSRKERWSGMNAKVLPYHWDDRDKLFADYEYLQTFYERLLHDLAKKLNLIHNVNHSLRYWRILIGPWLGYFTQMLFDRWTSIQQAIYLYELSETIILTGQDETLIPNDMSEFTRMYVGDEWNHHIYSSIIQEYTSVSCIKQVRQNTYKPKSTRVLPSVNWIGRAKKRLNAWYARIANMFVRDQDAFLLATHFRSFRDEMKLQLRLGQVPQSWYTVSPVKTKADLSWRQWVVPGENRTKFEECARAMIPRQIPTAYLEGYYQLVKQITELHWPKRPKVILTSNSYSTDDVFKAWTATKVGQGSPLVIGQHGGLYGIGRWLFVEQHEIAICDCYLSWGWTDPREPKVKPVGQLHAQQPSGICHSGRTAALLVTCTMPRQSYHMYSTIVSRQWLDYFNDQCTFIQRLPVSIRNVLTVRLYPTDYKWDQILRWRDRFPELCLDSGGSNMKSLILRSRLFISTYNATTFLETFAMNVPTVIYWNPNHWELRDSAIPYFEDLKRVGIFHESPESAADHVATIWDDVEGWWKSDSVVDVLERFKERYANNPGNLLSRIETVIRDVMKEKATPN